ncbi:MAG: glycosyltransferase family 4 protein [Verrucomicrobiae bacterium]|nr:glycosyltransferase family 4 protein [Verrucomicrobiae bacterium]
MKIIYPYPEEITFARAREVHTARMCEALALDGAEVIWLMGNTPGVAAPDVRRRFGLSDTKKLRLEFGPRYLWLGGRKVSTRPRYMGHLRRVLEREKCDVLYAIHLKLAEEMLSWKVRPPLVFEAHEIFADAYPEGHRRFAALAAQEQRVYPGCDALVATSAHTLESVRHRYGVPERSLIAWNAVAPGEFSGGTDRTHPGTAVYAGSLIPWKGVGVLLKAWQKLGGDYRLVVVGGRGEEIRPLEKFVHDAGMRDRVLFMGHRRRAELAFWLSRAEVCVLPNLMEPRSSTYSFPMKLLEYAAAGKRIVASAIPVVRELEAHFPGMILAEPGNAADLAEKLKSAFETPAPSIRPDLAPFFWETRAQKMKKWMQAWLTEKQTG